KTSKWNEAAMVRSRGTTLQRYTKVKSPESVELMVCAGCSHRWYVRNAGPVSCPRCGREVSFHDRVASTSMTMWSGDGMELTYVSENGFGCVYLWRDGVPTASRYAHEVLRRFGITISELVKSVNAGQMRDECRLLALDMLEHSEDYVRYVDYFMKRLSLGEDDARILAVHFTGMGPEAIARKFSLSDEQVRTAFDRIMAAYADSGIIVDDTIFTEDPFRFYGDT
ncbi:MAG: hypothetical protein Q4Q62_05220, partial [Thermoplasmata archaeon]|nr:hypothetical protein [Thermoplasmata archaeon]